MMGNTTGSVSGATPGMQQAATIGGQTISAAGANQANQQNGVLDALARMGPPPSLNTTQAPIAGNDIVGKYKGSLKPPGVNYRSRLNTQLDPSVGQMLTGVA